MGRSWCCCWPLAGATAWCFDEPAAEIVDTAPRTKAWRTTARTSGVAWLVAWWMVTVWLVRSIFHGHAVAVGLHGAAATLAITAVVTWLRTAGVPSPGMATAAVVMPTALFLALGRPYPQTIPIFPYVYGGPWRAASLWWGTLAALALGLLLVTVVDVPAPLLRLRHRPLAAGSR